VPLVTNPDAETAHVSQVRLLVKPLAMVSPWARSWWWLGSGKDVDHR